MLAFSFLFTEAAAYERCRNKNAYEVFDFITLLMPQECENLCRRLDVLLTHEKAYDEKVKQQFLEKEKVHEAKLEELLEARKEQLESLTADLSSKIADHEGCISDLVKVRLNGPFLKEAQSNDKKVRFVQVE